jgi:hypothetical protein
MNERINRALEKLRASKIKLLSRLLNITIFDERSAHRLDIAKNCIQSIDDLILRLSEGFVDPHETEISLRYLEAEFFNELNVLER